MLCCDIKASGQVPAASYTGPSEARGGTEPAPGVTLLLNQLFTSGRVSQRRVPSKKPEHRASACLPTPHQPGSQQDELILALKNA